MSTSLPEEFQDLDFLHAVDADVEEMADAHRDSILVLGCRYYEPAIVGDAHRAA